MTRLHVRNLLLGVVAVASLGLTACGGGFNCADKGKCNRDVAPSNQDITTCNNEISSKCGDKYKAYRSCLRDNEQCKADGSFDFDTTNQKCSNQFGDLTACCVANPSICNTF